MVQGDGTSDTAADRLAQLHHYFREHPVTGPEGHSYIGSGSRATAVAPGLPYNARVVEHIRHAVEEVVEHTRTVNPEAGPLPERVQDVYDWCREHTEHAPETDQQRRDTLIYRQRLEHAVQAGDHSVVRPHRCPSCGAPGLFWQEQTGRAVCVNRHCARRNGGTHCTFTLARLAYEQVAAGKSLGECAT